MDRQINGQMDGKLNGHMDGQMDGQLDRQIGNTMDNGSDDCLSFEDEWRVVAMTVDRLLLLLFSLVFLVGTIACFAHTKYVV